MKKIQIQALSKAQRQKLLNGKKIRVKKPIKGKGMNTLMIDPTKFNIISKLFDKDKGYEITMSMDELIATGEAELAKDIVEGEGIFGKKFDRWLKKHGLMKNIDKIAKPLKKVLFKAMDIGTKVGKEGLMKSKYGVAAVPVLDYANRVAQEYIDKPTEFQKNYKKKLIKKAGETGEQMIKDVVESATESLDKAEKAQQEQTEGKGLYVGKGVTRWNGKYQYGDEPGWINPQFMLRTTIAPIYWRGMYK